MSRIADSLVSVNDPDLVFVEPSPFIVQVPQRASLTVPSNTRSPFAEVARAEMPLQVNVGLPAWCTTTVASSSVMFGNGPDGPSEVGFGMGVSSCPDSLTR